MQRFKVSIAYSLELCPQNRCFLSTKRLGARDEDAAEIEDFSEGGVARRGGRLQERREPNARHLDDGFAIDFQSGNQRATCIDGAIVRLVEFIFHRRFAPRRHLVRG